MVDLFRYIEHNFAVPTATDAIDATNDSDFQTSLGEATPADPAGDPADAPPGKPPAAQAIRSLSEAYVAAHFPSPTADPTALGQRLDGLTAALWALDTVTNATVEAAAVQAFGQSSGQVVAADDFTGDRALLQNSVVAVKMSTGFDRADTARIVRQLRAMAVLERLAADDGEALDRTSLRALLQRPVRVPAALLDALRNSSPPPVADAPANDDYRQRVAGMQAQRDRLLAGYNALLAVAPQQLAMTTVRDAGGETRDAAQVRASDYERAVQPGERDPASQSVAADVAGTSPKAILTLGPAAREEFGRRHGEAVDALGLDIAAIPLDQTVRAFEVRLTELNTQLLPLEVATAAKVFRVGGHLFSEPVTSMKTMDAPAPGASAQAWRPLTRWCRPSCPTSARSSPGRSASATCRWSAKSSSATGRPRSPTSRTSCRARPSAGTRGGSSSTKRS